MPYQFTPKDATRFWSHVDKSGECWLWTRACNQDGYARMRVGSRRDDTRGSVLVHRLSWELQHGPIPGGLLVCHRCDVPNCVHPDHLFLGTKADNAADMVEKGRQSKGEHRPNRKLAAADVRALRRLYAQGGTSYRELAAAYGLNHGTVGHIVRGARWASVVEETK